MPRNARVTVPGEAHLIFQPTCNNQAVFSRKTDAPTYLEYLRDNAQLYKADILAYCLLRNRLYMILRPNNSTALQKTVGRTHFAYARYFHQSRDTDEPIWRNRFQSCIVHDQWLWRAAHYVDGMPVFEGLVKKAQEYAHSSAAAHLSGKDPLGLLSRDWLDAKSRTRFKKMLSSQLAPEIREKLRMFTQTGRPLGNDPFIKKLEKKFHRRLKPLPVGRPPMS